MPRTLVSSDAGVNANGECVAYPDSILTYQNSEDGKEYQAVVADSVSLLVNSLWEHSVRGVTLPIHILFDFVPIPHQLISEWLHSTDSKIGGLFYPQPFLDVESRVPKVHIQKHSPNVVFRSGVDTSIKVDICLYIFHREMDTSSELQSFNHTIWHPFSYGEWWYMYTHFAPIIEEECDTMRVNLLPSGGCTLFRRMMHTHFDDCALVLGKIWWEFGFGNMVQESGHDFTRRMLLGMYLSYNPKSPSLPLPPLFNAHTINSGQRVCAKCMVFKLGNGQMKRCPCHQVYYCSMKCQRADWKVHRVVCGAVKACQKEWSIGATVRCNPLGFRFFRPLCLRARAARRWPIKGAGAVLNTIDCFGMNIHNCKQ